MNLGKHWQYLNATSLCCYSVAKSCLTLCDPMDCSPPSSSVHRILPARILERVAIPFSRGSSWPRHQTWVSCIAGRFFTTSATWEARTMCSVHSLSHVCLFATPWTEAHQASLSITNAWSLLKLISIEWVMPSNHLILCHLLLLLSVFSSISVFSNESVLCIRWPKYWSFSISPSNEYSGLISFRIDWFDLLEVQVTLKSLLQHHSSKASILQYSAFFIVQLWHPYMTTGKIIALTRQTFVRKVMSLFFNSLSRFVTAFLPRSKNSL